MNGFTYIQELCTAVLKRSKTIQGRFFIAVDQGGEIDLDNLGKTVDEEVKTFGDGPRFPLVAMVNPMIINPKSIESNPKQDQYRASLFFLKTSYYNGNGSTIRENAIGTSTHSIVNDWDDMTRCAKDFLKVLTKYPQSKFFLMPSPVISPVSKVGEVNASGVRLDMNFAIADECLVIMDYTKGDIAAIQWPANDPHPFHP